MNGTAAAPPKVDLLKREAIDAWAALGNSRVSGVTVLKEAHRKSFVVRLAGAGPRSQPVVAKRCPAAVAEVERAVYSRILPSLPVQTLTLYGTSPAADGYTWLFLEDAGDQPWLPEKREHRVLAARWLGDAHVAAAPLVGEVELPSRGAGYHRELVRSARAVLDEGRANDAVDSSGRQLLDNLAERVDEIVLRWGDVEALLETVPQTLALPGFGAKNVRVRHGSAVPFDFEHAGWGPPAVELQQADPPAYEHAVRTWGLGVKTVRTLATVGAGLAALKAVSGEASTLASPWPQRALGKLEYYAVGVAAAVAALRGSDGGGRDAL